MYSTRKLWGLFRKLGNQRNFHTSPRHCKQEHPFFRTLRILRDDLFKVDKENVNEIEKSRALMGIMPTYCDVLIIGGGAMGSSIAYWLKEQTSREGISVVVVEKDTTYSKCSTTLSVGGLRQQFSLPENIQMSLFGADFLRTLKKRFGPDADVHFTPAGYLVLASEQGADQLIENHKLQKELGAVNCLLTKDQLKERFQWMNVDGVELGCLGLEKEGWFDPWALLYLLKTGAKEMGTHFVKGEVVDFTFEKKVDVYVDGVEEGSYEPVNEAIIKMPEGDLKNLKFSYCVVAAGCDSADIAKLARIGTGTGMLSIPLPVEKRKRYVYQFNCQGTPPGINTPMVIDHTGAYFRRDGLGGSFIGGMSPQPEDEPDTKDLEVDHKFFDEKVWPILAHRVPAFNAIKVKGAWSGYYEYNYFDENGIIGPHPYYHNLFFATGFSGHGIQQAPAVGLAISELILDGDFKTVDLTRLGFDRFIVDKPMYEIGIY